MPENMPIRYQIDFQMIPSLFYENKDGFRTHLLMAPESILADVYTNAHRKLQEGAPGLRFITFRPVDFLVQKRSYSSDRQLVYVSVPKPAEDDGSHVYCEAFALVSVGDSISLYTVEKSVFGTSCIGSVDRTGSHHNLGSAGKSTKENVEMLCKHFLEDAGKVLFERIETLQPDGGKVAMMINYESNTAEIHEYDSNGDLTMTTYGTISDPEEAHDAAISSDCDDTDVLFRAAETGDSEAQNRVGTMCYFGQRTEKDYHQALIWFKRAAGHGNADAMRNLAILYDNGEGTLRNSTRARGWYEKALSVNPEDAVAMNNLGVLCLSAERSVQSRSKAEPLIRKAAELGCPTAIENLTIMSAGGTDLKKANLPSMLKCGPDNTISNATKSTEKDINQCEEERNHSGFSSEDEEALMAELTRTIDSCSSAPITNDLEDRARWLMGRVEYFRRRGVPERKLYILEFRILQYMPDFVVRNFSQFYTFLREDISSIYVAVEFHLDKGNFAAAKKIADPLAQLLEKNKAALIDGHHCHQNSFELAMCTLETRKVLETPSTKDNYTAFLVAYARILQNTKDASGKRFLMCESRKYLRWAQSMSPQNASVWLYLGASYNEDEQMQLDCYQKALHYCYLKDDPYGLTAIYKHLAISYWFRDHADVTAALRELVVRLGDDAMELAFLLKKRSTPDRTPFRTVLQKLGIQIGFSDFVKETAEFLSNREGKLRDHSEIQKIINTVQTLRL